MTEPTNQIKASDRASKLVRGVSVDDRAARGLIDVHKVAELVSCCPSTVWRHVANRALPRPIKIGGMTRWSRAEIDAVIAEKLAGRADGCSGDD